MIANVIYDNIKDRKLLELVPSKFPIFINFIDFNTVNGRKEAFKIKGKWGAKLNPFIEVLDNNEIDRCFYSEDGNAVLKMIDWLNESII